VPVGYQFERTDKTETITWPLFCICNLLLKY